MGEFHNVVVACANDGRAQELRQKLSAVVERSRRDAGNRGYDRFAEQGDPRRSVFALHWSSPEAQDRPQAHIEHVRRFEEDDMDAVERLERAPGRAIGSASSNRAPHAKGEYRDQ